MDIQLVAYVAGQLREAVAGLHAAWGAMRNIEKAVALARGRRADEADMPDLDDWVEYIATSIDDDAEWTSLAHDLLSDLAPDI